MAAAAAVVCRSQQDPLVGGDRRGGSLRDGLDLTLVDVDYTDGSADALPGCGAMGFGPLSEYGTVATIGGVDDHTA